MADLSEAMKEAYAGVRPELIYYCLRFTYPTISPDVFVVQGNDNLTAKILPTDTSTTEFKAVQFTVTRPKQVENALPEIELRIDNVGNALTAHLDAAALSDTPIKVHYYEFLESTKLQGAEVSFALPFEITEIDEDIMGITAKASLPDVLGQKFPRQKITTKDFPGLLQ